MDSTRRDPGGGGDDGWDDPPRSLVFRVAGRVYACDATEIREVLPRGAVTPLPGAPATVLGLVNVRGTIVTLVDGGLLLHGVPAAPTGTILVVDHGARGVGIAVDGVADVRAVRSDEEYLRCDLRAVAAAAVTVLEDR